MGTDLEGEGEPGAGPTNENEVGKLRDFLRNIRLNTDLAKKPLECLEYIVLHEMAHLLEPTHNARFVALMDAYMPNWQFQRGLLNRLPVRQDEWDH